MEGCAFMVIYPVAVKLGQLWLMAMNCPATHRNRDGHYYFVVLMTGSILDAVTFRALTG
jgi:hypothetical protein